MKKSFNVLSLLLITVALLLSGCGQGSTPYDSNASVPKGDPQFPPLGHYWVIDKAGVLSQETVEFGDRYFEELKQDWIAEVVLLVMEGVKHPEDYATRYGRWLRLGRKGPSTEGGNNGVVWLIRPDAREKITISVGRGLPKFTSSDYGRIMEDSVNYLNFGNYDSGVRKVVEGTDRVLRKIYGKPR
jgi:uncharacterized membrane protein YgcG